MKPCFEPHISTADYKDSEMRYQKNKIVCSLKTRMVYGWRVMKDGRVMYMGRDDVDWDDTPTLRHMEVFASRKPYHDYRAILRLPERTAEYQRQDKGKWILVNSSGSN